MFKILWPNFVTSCFLQIDRITLWYADYQLDIYFFNFFFCSVFLVCNYINNIYLFQKLSIFLSFREVQIWLIQLPYCEANFVNLYVTVQMLWLIYNRAGKIRYMLVLCACLSPKVSSRRTKECVPKLFMSSDLSSL